MENILSQRLKNIIGIGAIALVSIIITAVVFFDKTKVDDEGNAVFKTLSNRIQIIENKLEKQIREFQARSNVVSRDFREKTIEHVRMDSKEALIIEQEGVIEKYFGEIYYYKFPPLQEGEWAFIIKNQDLYFARKMADHIYYVSYFCNLEKNVFLDQISPGFASAEIKYHGQPLPDQVKRFYYDNVKKMFLYSHLLAPSNSQLTLQCKLSKDAVVTFYKEKRGMKLCILALVLLALLIVWFSRKRWLVLTLGLCFLLDLLLLLALKGGDDFYFKLNLWVVDLRLTSISQCAVLLLMFTSVIFFLRGQLGRIKGLSFFLFNFSIILIYSFFDDIFDGVDFNYMELGFNQLMLMFSVFLLYLFPLLMTEGVKKDLDAVERMSDKKILKPALFLVVQSAIAAAIWGSYSIPFVNAGLVVMTAFIMIFIKKGFFSRAWVVFFAAIIIYQLASGYSFREKREFIDKNLKNIFLNQSNYAKFIAREIVHEINLSSSGDFYEFFQDNTDKTSAALETIWRRTIASQENIASGIFVVSKDTSVLSYFAYQIPFLEVKSRAFFPFWAVEDTTAEVNGKDIPLASASINIFKGSEFLGRIIVQVLNSPELLLRYQEKVNIFTTDNKIDGRDLSYVKLNARNQIVENPSNINFEDINRILQQENQWIKFKYMGIDFEGYLFKHNKNSILIFFPGSSLVKDLSEIIQLFLLISFFILLFNSRKLTEIKWKTIYYSFSIRVFFFLILISLLTAVLFSVFFIDFSSRSSEQKITRIVYENGRIAQDLAYNLIKRRGGFSKLHLYSISDILNSDVSVYDNGELLETSNYRKIINSQIPIYLHSKISTLLDEKNQKFVLFEEEKGFYLFFKIYDYVFMVEISNNWEKVLSEERYYTDFIIVMFFILVVIGFSVAFFFRNKILSPIEGLNQGMAEVEKGNLTQLENIPSEIEMKNLYMGFNAMIDGIREQKKSVSEIARMKTIIKLGRRVAHEVKNPLTPIKLSAEQIMRALKDKNPRYEEIILQSVNYIIDETDHLKKVSYGFLDLSKLDEVDAVQFNMMDLIQEEMFNVRQIYSHIEFSVKISGGDSGGKFSVSMDKFKIKQVLKNLIMNSIEAIGEKTGNILVFLKKYEGRILMEVIDNGIGMDENERSRAFDVDYSTKEVGTGLGLFIVKRIIEIHKGNIEIYSEKYKGTRVVLELPEKVETV